jgi:hypothetical protein
MQHRLTAGPHRHYITKAEAEPHSAGYVVRLLWVQAHYKTKAEADAQVMLRH